ncbi:Gfo/Idh/MocA family protein [Paraburkholderia fungorum]|uniref:Gfo/Idh/MocA family protein n=1 Tax=Paraburkholderia fungorum TaxID=134537 RepID=UPI0020930595|nr:Gfo/Idh/MocA family oxidoreductase [Paraburkholderia fungorum]USU17780.1 Gfo/Idh/MocA family oxidoreductase [Paraburkholderia fungorum]USU25724.1 Gfo/Idh/MocA family oxidoreductase [Paraburkholderia fungorum]
MTEKIRWGVLGAAKIADNFVVPAIQRSSNGQVITVASRDRDRAQIFATRHGIDRVLTSYDEVIASKDVDAIYIPLPTASHVEWCKKALLGGKHVLCEKPIAMNANQVLELIALRDKTGLVCGEAFMVAHHPQWAFVRDSLAQGMLGELTLIEGSFTYFNDDPNALKNNLALGGGGVRDIGVYPVVTTRLVTGLEPVRIQAEVLLDARFGTDRFARCTAAFPGFSMTFYCGTQLSRRQHMIFHGTKGWLSVDAPFNPGTYGPAQIRLRSDETAQTRTIEFGDVDQYQLMVEDFASTVLGQKANLAFTLENSLGNQRVIDQILS